jgi:GNAT superfamily N-acetyltransferase
MHYVRGLPADERAHRTRHDSIVNGTPSRAPKSDIVVWRERDARITVVTPCSPIAQRRLAARAGRLANMELRYDGGVYDEYETPDSRDLHIFLYHRGERIVGFMIVERRTHIFRWNWSATTEREPELVPGAAPTWTVGFLWVHRASRRTGVGRSLIRAAVERLGIKEKLFAWYPPFSSAGEAFARSIHSKVVLLGK